MCQRISKGFVMETYDMACLGAELGLPKQLFLTAEKGEQAYWLLRNRLEQVPDGQSLLLIFPESQLVDASFADKTIIRLGGELLRCQSKNVALILQGLTEDSIKNIEAIISFRRLKLAFLAVGPAGAWQCIGQLDPALKELLYLLAEHHQLTAPQLAELLKLEVNTASTRLKRLYDRHLIWREYESLNKGIQYHYHFWQWVEEPLKAKV
jgi:hypothetical protein